MIIRVQFEFNNMLVSVNSGEQVSDLILIKLSSHDTMNLQDSCDKFNKEFKSRAVLTAL
jgi:hypothetical protein